jgi:hypothetical protein
MRPPEAVSSLDLAAAGDIGQWLTRQAPPRGSAPVPRRSKGCRDDDRILEFLRNRHEDGPCLGLALDVVRDDMLLSPIGPRERRKRILMNRRPFASKSNPMVVETPPGSRHYRQIKCQPRLPDVHK